jgi:acyl carrier protein
MEQDSRARIEATIKRLLISELNVSAATVDNTTPATSLLGRGIGLDSVEIMALVVSLEEEFQISVPDTELTVNLFESIGALADYVAQALLEKTNGWVRLAGRS